jgi:phage terminase small subunit
MVGSMKAKLTPKQEAFCRAYVETGNASEAYRRSYNAENMNPATVNRKAKFEFDKGKIGARIEELQERAQRKHDVTIETLTDMYRDAFEMGKDIEQPAAMNGSATGLAKLHGLITDKSQAELSVSFGFAERLAKRRADRK